MVLFVVGVALVYLYGMYGGGGWIPAGMMPAPGYGAMGMAPAGMMGPYGAPAGYVPAP
eukprot:gene56264-28435_t